MNRMVIKRATLEDRSVIECILFDAVKWLNEMNQPLWRIEDVKWEALAKSYLIEDFYIAYGNNEPSGCMALVDFDPVFWPDVAKGEALMIHKLAVVKNARKAGVADALIQYAKEEGRKRQVGTVRLDCRQDRQRLRSFYERHGFVCVHEKTLRGKWDVAFYSHSLIWKG